jgi:hypothetical protein
MTMDCRAALIAILTQLDQIAANAESLTTEPARAELHALAEELKDSVTKLQQRVEEKLDEEQSEQ